VRIKSDELKQKILHEVIEYWIIFGYIAFFLFAFTWYRRFILAQYHIDYTEYWFPLIEAAVLAKVVMVGDFLGLGRGLERKPLILSTLYQTFVFSLWVAVFSLVEKTVRGLLHGKGIMSGIDEMVDKGGYEFLSWCIVAFVTFMPFFGFRELGRVLGKARLRALFWRRGSDAADSFWEGKREDIERPAPKNLT